MTAVLPLRRVVRPVLLGLTAAFAIVLLWSVASFGATISGSKSTAALDASPTSQAAAHHKTAHLKAEWIHTVKTVEWARAFQTGQLAHAVQVEELQKAAYVAAVAAAEKASAATAAPAPASSATTTTPAPAASSSSETSGDYGSWQQVADCETGGNWSMEGSEYSGGLGFSNATWDAYGGTAYASNAGEATPEEQISVAERIQSTPPDQDGCSGW